MRMFIIAGPCAVEGKVYIEMAKGVQKAGATHLRGGIFKPRSSPYRWDGLGKKGLDLLIEAKKETGLPIVAEAMSQKQIEILYPHIDIFQIGTRNSQASELLKEFGRQDKPVILKRGMAMLIDEFIMAADFILSEGNHNVILCERGIRTFETYTRNTFDINCIAAVKHKCSLPIIADASHGTGVRELVVPVTLAALAAGADGAMIEVHSNPERAKTDGGQSLTMAQFEEAVKKMKLLKEVI